MATIKSFSDLEQSKKLAKILPIESADMCYKCIEDDPYDIIIKPYSEWKEKYKGLIISGEVDVWPCWSLAALLEQLPYELCDDDGNSSYLQINKEDDVFQLEYTDPYGDFESIQTDRYEHFIDACYEMILKLHELKVL